MKFRINRASNWDDKAKPCENAYSEPWKGLNAEKLDWFIDLHSLDDLAVLIAEEGELIISKDGIIIYDDYVE